MEYVVDLIWDNEAGVWIAISDDVKGLALEFESIEGLIERVKLATPELLWLNYQGCQVTNRKKLNFKQ